MILILTLPFGLSLHGWDRQNWLLEEPVVLPPLCPSFGGSKPEGEKGKGHHLTGSDSERVHTGQNEPQIKGWLVFKVTKKQRKLVRK